MDVNAAVKGYEFAAEDGLDHIVARDDVPGSFEEKGEQIKFDRGEFDLAVFAVHGASPFVQLDIAENDRFRNGGRRIGRGKSATPENRLNAGGEFARIKGLHQVVVGADFEAVDAIDIVAAGSEHDHGEARFLTDLAERFKAFQLGKHYIEDHQGEVAGNGALEAFCAVVRDVDAEAFGLEVLAEKLAKLNVIIDHENAGQRRVRVFALLQVHGMRAAIVKERRRAWV
ncbi:MAG: hypothetical protein WAN72_25850 [Candidatus Acidiferrales bacterium]